MPPEGNELASGSPRISSLPLNSTMALPSPVGARKLSCFSAVRSDVGVAESSQYTGRPAASIALRRCTAGGSGFVFVRGVRGGGVRRTTPNDRERRERIPAPPEGRANTRKIHSGSELRAGLW